MYLSAFICVICGLIIYTSFPQNSIIHNFNTINDQLVSVEHGKKLFKYLNEPKNIHLFEQGDHNTIFSVNQSEYFQILFNFLQE